MLDKAIEEHSSEEILDAVEAIYLDQIEGNAVIFRCALEFANIHNGDAHNASGRVLPGMERAIQLGGPGTPRVMEFAAAEFGARMQMGTFAAKRMFADAQDTWHRLPRLWDRVWVGEVKVRYARHVAQETRHLSLEAAGFVDAAVAESADGRITWSRFEDMVAGKVVEVDPEAAAAKEAEAALKQFAKATRSSEHGMKAFYLRSTAGVIARFDATVAYLAEALKALGDTDNEDLRRVKACLIMANPAQAIELLAAHKVGVESSSQILEAQRRGSGDSTTPAAAGERGTNPHHDETDNRPPIGEGDLHPSQNNADEPGPGPCPTCNGDGNPEAFTKPFRPGDIQSGGTGEGFAFDWSKLLPSVTLYLHLSQDTIIRDAGGVARWEGEGPISAQYIREHLGLYHRFDIKPVIDCANMAPVDAYEIPDRHREAVHLRTPADSFPYSSNTTRDVDIDHTVPHVPPERGGPPGQSRLGNYGPMVRFHHRIKTHGPWEVRQPFPGIYIWRDPHDHHYLVDHTGTRKISRPRGEGAAKARLAKQNPDLALQIFLDRDPIDYAYAHAA